MGGKQALEHHIVGLVSPVMTCSHPLRVSSLSGRLLAVWLLLATVIGQALVPADYEPHARTGSAFSAFTSDVTTMPFGSNHRVSAAKKVEPDGGIPPLPDAVLATVGAGAAPPRDASFHVQAPNAHLLARLWQLPTQPRAPPIL
jgi:hypothetical protein